MYIALVAFFVGCAEVAYDDEIIDESVASGEFSANQNAIDLPKVAKSTPQIATKSKQKTKPTPTKSNAKSTNSKSAQSTQKSANHNKDSQTLLDSPTMKAQTPSDSPNLAKDSPNAIMIQAQDSANLADLSNVVDSIDLANLAQNPQDSRILNKSTPRAKSFFDASKLNQPLPQLHAQCDSRDLQKCEDLGRIYAVQEKRDLATAHYKKACNNGKGRVMSCFFNSLIFANNGDNATASEYLGAISGDTLSALKIDEVELMLSISEIALIKDKLKISCASGESTSCNALLSVFKIRGEIGEAKAFFSAECSRAKKQNSTPCVILKGL